MGTYTTQGTSKERFGAVESVSAWQGVFSAEEITEQMERVVGSAHFRNSRRYPLLLRFLVVETLAGRTESLKERTLGVEVFGRSPDYDTNADPVVRITAGEIRKRIAQYYQGIAHKDELRIELPLGSYLPRFTRAAGANLSAAAYGEPADTLPVEQESSPDAMGTLPMGAAVAVENAPSQETPEVSPEPGSARWAGIGWRKIVAGAAVLLAVAAAVWMGVARHHREEEAQDLGFFWEPVLQSNDPPLIVLGVSSSNEAEKYDGEVDALNVRPDQDSAKPPSARSDVVPLGDVLSYGRLVTLLAQRGRPYRTLGAMDTTFQELRQGPVVLIGGFNNFWTRRLASRLRYRFNVETNTVRDIVDSEKPGVVWQRDISPDASSYRDFGIVACFYDPRVERYILLAGGIGRHGTAAAAEFLTDSRELRQWAEKQHLDKSKNVEIVLSTEVIGGEHGPPHVVASATW